MANPYYLVSAKPEDLAGIAKYARKLTASRHGDPLFPLDPIASCLCPWWWDDCLRRIRNKHSMTY